MKERIQRHIHDIRTYQKEGKQVPLSDMEFHTCPSCGHDFFGKFCPHCGEKGNVKRFKMKTMIMETFINVARLDNSLLRTFTDIIVRPGHMINDYLHGRRKMYVTPVKLFLIIFIIFGAIKYFFPENIAPITEDAANSGDDITNWIFSLFGDTISHYLRDISNWFNSQPYSSELYPVPFEMLAFKIIFRNTNYRDSSDTPNWAETFIILIYIHCINVILDTIAYPFNANTIFSILSIIYIPATLHQLFEFNWWKAIWKSIVFVVTGIAIAIVIAVFFIVLMQICTATP